MRLSNGVECPILGLGNNEDNLTLAGRMVKDAIAAGYRHIDTAAFYENEEAVGQALNELFKQGKVKREEVFVTSKIFFQDYPSTNRKKKTVEAVQLALKKLGLDYVDSMLIHWPASDSKVNSEIWSGLEDALDRRLVRAIGVSNFNEKQLEELMRSAKVMPQVNQIRSNPRETNQNLIDYCKRFGIQVTAYSPLGKGTLLKDKTLTDIAKKHKKSAAQVVIRWHLQRGVVAIPKSTKAERIKDNFNVWDFSLTEADMKKISSMNSSRGRGVSIVLILLSLLISVRKLFWKLTAD